MFVRHNLAYWRGWDYIGVGPGASSRVTTDQARYSLIQIKHPSKWMDAVLNSGSGTAERTQLSTAQTAMVRISTVISKNNICCLIRK